MKKLLFGLFLLSSFSFSAIDECKTDIYFANGILTEAEDARKNARDILRPAIIEELGLDYFNKKIGKVDYAYNETHGETWDLIESTLQKLGPTGLVDWLLDTTRKKNIEKQVTQYKKSITDGHKVLVVAHSQGNLFTQEVYLKLDGWMKEYFDGVSIASPGMYPMIPTAKNPISWDNDLVAWLGLYTKGLIQNDIRKVNWEVVHPNGQLTIPYVQRPTSNYVPQSDMNKTYKGEWRATESKFIENSDSNVHAFTFYMGGVLKDGTSKEVFKNPFDGKTMQTNKARIKIMSEIKTKLGVLDKVESQWQTDQESDKNTCDRKITVKHRYDPSIEMGEKVYPFSANKKLYQVKGEYVKASCGGKNILETWDGKKDDECLMIDNVEEEKIINKRFVRDNIKEVVLDHKYNLKWQDNANGSAMNWYVANNYCNDLEFGGYSNWRLPLFQEMFDPIVYNTDGSQGTDKAFQNMNLIYWSAGIFDDPASVYDKAQAYNYAGFTTHEFDVRVALFVRCVSQE